MTKKDYELIARVIRKNPSLESNDLIEAMTDALEQDNRRFNRAKFLEACGLDAKDYV